MAERHPYNHRTHGGGNIAFVAFFVIWATVLTLTTVGFAYFCVSAIASLSRLQLVARNAMLTNLVPRDPAAYVALDLAELTPEERGSIAAFSPVLAGIHAGNAAIFGLRDKDGLLHWAVLLHAVRPLSHAAQAIFRPFRDGTLLATDPWMTERITTAVRAGDVFSANGDAMLALSRLADLSPIIGYVNMSRLTDAAPKDLADWLPEGAVSGFAVRQNAKRLLGFAAPVPVIAAKNGFFGLALPMPSTREAQTFATPMKKIVEISGREATPEILAALFDNIEEKRSTFGSALDGVASAEAALSLFLGKSFHFATLDTAQRWNIAHINGICANDALIAIKTYLSRALPVRVPRRLPDGQTLDEYLIADWPAFDGEEHPGPAANYRYDGDGIHISISGDRTGVTITTSSDTGVAPIHLASGLPKQLRQACQGFLGDNSTIFDLSTLVNTFYTQLNLGQVQRRISLNALLTSVDNSVVFCE